MVQQPRLNASAHVLEGPRRPVEELEHPRAVRDLDERNREVERVPHERMEVLGGDFVAQQVLADNRRDLDDIGRPDGVQARGRQRFKPLRKIQSPVRRGPREKRVDKRDRGRRTPCRNPLHRNWPILSLRRTRTPRTSHVAPRTLFTPALAQAESTQTARDRRPRPAPLQLGSLLPPRRLASAGQSPIAPLRPTPAP